MIVLCDLHCRCLSEWHLVHACLTSLRVQSPLDLGQLGSCSNVRFHNCRLSAVLNHPETAEPLTIQVAGNLDVGLKRIISTESVCN